MARKLRFFAVLFACAIPIVLVDGCGGSGGSSPEAAVRAQFIAQADPICRQVNAKRVAFNASLGYATSLSKSRTRSAIEREVPALVAYERQALVQLQALKAPTSMAANWQAILSGLRQISTNTGRLVSYAKSNNVKASARIAPLDRGIWLKLLPIAAREGFAHCGRLT